MRGFVFWFGVEKSPLRPKPWTVNGARFRRRQPSSRFPQQPMLIPQPASRIYRYAWCVQATPEIPPITPSPRTPRVGSTQRNGSIGSTPDPERLFQAHQRGKTGNTKRRRVHVPDPAEEITHFLPMSRLKLCFFIADRQNPGSFLRGQTKSRNRRAP